MSKISYFYHDLGQNYKIAVVKWSKLVDFDHCPQGVVVMVMVRALPPPPPPIQFVEYSLLLLCHYKRHDNFLSLQGYKTIRCTKSFVLKQKRDVSCQFITILTKLQFLVMKQARKKKINSLKFDRLEIV